MLSQRHSPDAGTRQLVEAPSRVVMAGATNPVEDAAAERRKATFPSDELAAFLQDGADKLQRRCATCGCSAGGRLAASAACLLLAVAEWAC